MKKPPKWYLPGMFEHHRFEADNGQALLRVDKFLMVRLPNASRTKIQEAADAGNILVNGKAVKSSYKVKPKDIVSVVMAYPRREIEIIPEDIPLNIVYEDEDLIVVNKPGRNGGPSFLWTLHRNIGKCPGLAFKGKSAL